MASTPNFAWPTPDDTDPVGDGALDMRSLGNAIDATLGASWISYTPSLGPWVQGNGTFYARYYRLKNFVTFEMQFVVGSTSVTSGLGPLFSLPVVPRVGSRWAYGFSGFALDVSVGTQAPLRAWPVSTNNFYPVLTNTTTTYGDTYYISGTTPFTWANGDILLMFGTYEAA
jgi:hypothetical protein